MTGPFTLIRKKSQKLKRKLSKHEKKTEEPARYAYNTSRYGNENETLDYNCYSPIGTSSPTFPNFPRNTHSVSFDLSPIEVKELSVDIPHYDFNRSRSTQNLQGYTNNPNNKENIFYESDSTKSRRSLDNLGTLIKIPKRTASPPSASNSNFNPASNRLSFDIASYQLNKSKIRSGSKRVTSDSSLYSNSRPTSMILDSDKTLIPPYSIHSISSNNYTNKTKNSIYGSIYPDRLSRSAISLNTYVDPETLAPENSLRQSTSLLRAKSTTHGSRHTHHSHNHGNHKHDYSSRKKVPKRVRDNQGVVSADIDRWSLETPSNVLFAIIFHILNIFFSVCVYLPIYILVRFGYLSFLLVGLGILAWCMFGGSPSTSVVVNLQHTISEI